MFLLDANVFMDASRLYSRPGIAPTFWDWLAAEHERGNIASVEKVLNEINNGYGHLTEWAKQVPSSFWLKSDAATAPSMTQLSAWTTHKDRNYTQAAKDAFFRSADYYLVAQAHSGKHRVVTFEQPAPEAKSVVKIPDACKALNVTGIEPAYRAWEASALPLSYARLAVATPHSTPSPARVGDAYLGPHRRVPKALPGGRHDQQAGKPSDALRNSNATSTHD